MIRAETIGEWIDQHLSGEIHLEIGGKDFLELLRDVFGAHDTALDTYIGNTVGIGAIKVITRCLDLANSMDKDSADFLVTACSNELAVAYFGEKS